jgi:hypothetical protein
VDVPNADAGDTPKKLLFFFWINSSIRFSVRMFGYRNSWVDRKKTEEDTLEREFLFPAYVREILTTSL